MSFVDKKSAIDDSSPAIHFGTSFASSLPRSRAHIATPITNEDAQIYGPRSGHWSVSSGNNISAIDDRSSTLRDPGTSSACLDRGRCSEGKRMEPIARATLRKLHAVKLAEEKFQPEAQKDRSDKVRVEHKRSNEAEKLNQMRNASSSGIGQSTRQLFLPRTADRLGIKISGRNGQSFVVREPSKASRATLEHKLSNTEEAKSDQTGAKTSLSNHQRSQSLAHISLGSKTHQVRIKGKNGEIAFVDLPAMSRSSHSSPASRTHKVYSSAKVEEDSAKQQRLAAKAAREPKTQREREDLDELAANPVMSGALGGPVRGSGTDSHKVSSASSRRNRFEGPRVPSPMPQSSSSSRTRTPASIRSIFDEGGQVVSEASSRTSIQPPQVRLTSPSLEPVEDHYIQFAQSNRNGFGESSVHQSSSNHKPNPTSKHSNSRSRYEQGEPNWEGVTQSSQSKRQPSRPPFVSGSSRIYGYPGEQTSEGRWSRASDSQGTFEHNFGELETVQWREAPSEHHIPGVWDNLSASIRERQTPSSLRSHSDSVSSPPHRDPRQTIYAGHGWISPHPLSVASSHEPPQSAIRLPSRSGIYDEGAMLTYEEWMRGRRAANSLHQSSRVRTLSDRTSSNSHGWGNYGPSVQSSERLQSREATLVDSRENNYRASVVSDHLRERPSWSAASPSYVSEFSQRSRPWYVQSDSHSSSRSSTFRAQGGAANHW